MKSKKPNRLQEGDTIRIIAPSRSMSILGWQAVNIATERLMSLGLEVTFGKNVLECDECSSSSIASRIEDLHAAFADPAVKAIFTAIGGFNSNQLLNEIDYALVSANPKILCGYSDITALANALYARSGLITYSGPHFSSFAMKKGFDYTLDYFRRILMQDDAVELEPSSEWSNDLWYADQENREFVPNNGPRVICRGGEDLINGTIVGGNISAFAALFGTKYAPPFVENTILFLEECEEQLIQFFDRLLHSIIYQDGFEHVKAILIGRFENKTAVSEKALEKIIRSKKQLQNVLVAVDLNFGHTTPIFTFPIGGRCSIDAREKLSIVIE